MPSLATCIIDSVLERFLHVKRDAKSKNHFLKVDDLDGYGYVVSCGRLLVCTSLTCLVAGMFILAELWP